jgi:hypothetical protein
MKQNVPKFLANRLFSLFSQHFRNNRKRSQDSQGHSQEFARLARAFVSIRKISKAVAGEY